MGVANRALIGHPMAYESHRMDVPFDEIHKPYIRMP